MLRGKPEDRETGDFTIILTISTSFMPFYKPNDEMINPGSDESTRISRILDLQL